MGRASLRDSILNAGLKVMVRKGYAGAGVRDIVAEARAPRAPSPTISARRRNSRARCWTFISLD